MPSPDRDLPFPLPIVSPDEKRETTLLPDIGAEVTTLRKLANRATPTSILLSRLCGALEEAHLPLKDSQGVLWEIKFKRDSVHNNVLLMVDAQQGTQIGWTAIDSLFKGSMKVGGVRVRLSSDFATPEASAQLLRYLATKSGFDSLGQITFLFDKEAIEGALPALEKSTLPDVETLFRQVNHGMWGIFKGAPNPLVHYGTGFLDHGSPNFRSDLIVMW